LFYQPRQQIKRLKIFFYCLPAAEAKSKHSGSGKFKTLCLPAKSKHFAKDGFHGKSQRTNG